MDRLTGWSSPYYVLPEGATELQDLIEHKRMNFAVGNIFKACYRLGEKHGTDATYDLEKIVWFAQRELERRKRELDVRDFGAVADPWWHNIRSLTEGWPSPRCSICQNQPCTCNPNRR